MEQYPKYKPSGIEWIGEIPEHWEVQLVRRITIEHKQGFYSTEEYVDNGIKMLRITDIDDNSNISFSDCPRVSISDKEYEDFKLEKHDFLFARSGTIGRFGINRNESQKAIFASYLIRFRYRKDIYPEFLRFYFLSNLFKEGLISVLHGGANKNVHAENIKDQIICLPPKKEQTTIANFLDDKTAKIDALIEKKKKLIELFKEERTAIINQAVTHGIYPDVKLKPSGIYWLGDIPEHWIVKKLKYVAKVQSSNVDKKTIEGENPILLCNYIDVYKNEFIDESFDFMEATATDKEIDKFILKKGDVLITKDSETPDDIANPSLVKQDFHNVICGYHLAQIRSNKYELIGEFLFRLFQSKQFNSHFEVSANGVTRFGLPLDSITDVEIIFPTIDEQDIIVQHIEIETKRIDETISIIEKEIKLLTEYRTALINEVVTGKIKVI